MLPPGFPGTPEKKAELAERAARVKMFGFDAKSGSHIGGGWPLLGYQRVELSADELVASGFRVWWWLYVRFGYIVLTDRRLIFGEPKFNNLLPLWRRQPFVLNYDEIQSWRVERRRNIVFFLFPQPALVLRTRNHSEHVLVTATPRFAEAAAQLLPGLPLSS